MLNVPGGHITESKSCSAKTTSLGGKTFSVSHAGFYNADLDATLSTTATVKVTGSGAFSGPRLSWRVDATSVGGAFTSIQPKGSRMTFGRGSELESTLLWLKPGTHSIGVSVVPFAEANNKPACGSYRTAYSGLHARLVAAR